MISIVTPTYNREVLVQRTIQSILDQVYQDWELIVVDDGSTDNTEQAIQKFLKDSRIRYIKKQNSGQADSLNTGVSHTKGDFITFLDSDDEAYSEWLQVVHDKIDQNTGIVSTEAYRKFLNGNMVREGFDAIRFMGKKIYIKFTCGSLFIRRSVFQAINGYDIELKSNIQTDLGYRLLLHLKDTDLKMVTIPQPLVQINIHEGPRIRTNWDKMNIGGIQFLNKHHDMFYKYDREVLSYLCGSIAFYNYKLKNRSQALNYMLKAIRYHPLRLVNYPRILKYTCL